MKRSWLMLGVPVLAAAIGVPVAAVSAAPAAPSACSVPADVLDLANWKETLPTGESEHPDEVEQPDLAKFGKDPWFTTTPGCDAVQFRAAVNGVTTSGSGNPRSELREMNGSDEASWSTAEGTHTMEIDEAVTHLPNDKPHVVAGQIHDADDDVTVFRLEGTKLYITKGDDTHYKLVTDDYQLGTRFKAKFVAADGKIDAFYNDKLVATVDADSSGDYFKAGAYTQANCDKSDPCSDDNYGEVLIYGLTVTHEDGTKAATCANPDGLKLRDQDPDDEQLPWQRKGDEETVVYFETKGLPAEFLDDVKQGVESWDRSPCVQPKITDTCQSGTNCVTIGLEDSDDDDDDGNFDAVEEGGFTTGGHITYYTDPLSEEGPTATLNVVKHEMGHAIGLRHRATEGVLMYADTNDTTEPDDIDYDNLLVLYGDQ